MILLGLGLSASAQVAPIVTTHSATEIGATSAVLNASFTVGQAQHLVNPGFEAPLGPSNWNSAALVYLEGESSPVEASFLRRTTDAQNGVACGELRYRTKTMGLVGISCPQEVSGIEVSHGVPLILSYWVRHQYSYGTGDVPDHGGLVEVEVRAGGETYWLRYYHLRKGALPTGRSHVYYVDAGNPGQYTWVRYEQDLTSDIATAFGLGEFSVRVVRLGVLLWKTSDAETRLYWLFDDVELKRGGAVVWHEYREEGSPSWQATPRATYTADGTHAAAIVGLAPGTAYRHRAVLAYEGGLIYGAEREFRTLQAYTVQVRVQPPTGGTADGAGTYPHGTIVTVTAAPRACYRFVNWTEAGVEVWAAPSYSFAATADRDLVANFVLVGDANLDGVVDVRDARLVHQAALGLVALAPPQRVAADVNGDGVVDTADAQLIAEALLGLPVPVPICPGSCP
ncbi:hypothetical protein H5T55_04545 [Candidatus Bipolaricaulota bacterium]|nr:hypothetical protein [Candidatus Bipolaricaulota bacterium]